MKRSVHWAAGEQNQCAVVSVCVYPSVDFYVLVVAVAWKDIGSPWDESLIWQCYCSAGGGCPLWK